MSVGRFSSAIVAGMLAGGLTAMSGIGDAHADARATAAGTPVAAQVVPKAAAKITIVDPR